MNETNWLLRKALRTTRGSSNEAVSSSSYPPLPTATSLPSLPRNLLLVSPTTSQSEQQCRPRHNFYTPSSRMMNMRLAPSSNMMLMTMMRNDDSDSSLNTLIPTSRAKPPSSCGSSSLKALISHGIGQKRSLSQAGSQLYPKRRKVASTTTYSSSTSATSLHQATRNNQNNNIKKQRKQVSFSTIESTSSCSNTTSNHFYYTDEAPLLWWTDAELSILQHECSALIQELRRNDLYMTALRLLHKLCQQSSTQSQSQPTQSQSQSLQQRDQMKTVCIQLLVQCDEQQQDEHENDINSSSTTSRGLERYVLGQTVRSAMKQHHAETLAQAMSPTPPKLVDDDDDCTTTTTATTTSTTPQGRTSSALAALLGNLDARSAAAIHHGGW